MEKARQDLTSVTWTWVRDIYPLILQEICGSPQSCGPWLVKQIAADRVRWRSVDPPNEPHDNFWQEPLPTIDFEECTATKLVVATTPGVVGLVSITLRGFQVVREDIEALRQPKQAQIRVLDSFPKIQGDRIPPHRIAPPTQPSKSTRGRDPELSDEEIARAIELLQTENKKERETRGKDLKKNSAVSLLKDKMLRNGRPIPIEDRTWRRQVVWKVLPKRPKQSRTDK
jgi:hypothetical protein